MGTLLIFTLSPVTDNKCKKCWTQELNLRTSETLYRLRYPGLQIFQVIKYLYFCGIFYVFYVIVYIFVDFCMFQCPHDSVCPKTQYHKNYCHFQSFYKPLHIGSVGSLLLLFLITAIMILSFRPDWFEQSV